MEGVPIAKLVNQTVWVVGEGLSPGHPATQWFRDPSQMFPSDGLVLCLRKVRVTWLLSASSVFVLRPNTTVAKFDNVLLLLMTLQERLCLLKTKMSPCSAPRHMVPGWNPNSLACPTGPDSVSSSLQHQPFSPPLTLALGRAPSPQRSLSQHLPVL